MLKKCFSVAIFIASLFAMAAFANSGSVLTPDELAEKYRVAHKAWDYDAITELVNWKDVRKGRRKKFQVYTMATFGLEIKEIRIEEVGPDHKFKKTNMGMKELMPNHPVTHLMKVEFEVGKDIAEEMGKDTIIYLLGKNKSEYMITLYVRTGSSANSGYH